MLLCLECGEYFDNDTVMYDSDSDWNWCPKQDCGGMLIDVDELFVPIIYELNNKGYTTKFCCSGHIHEGHGGCINSYINFDTGNYNFKDELLSVALPCGYEIKDYDDQVGNLTIRRYFDNSKKKSKLLIDVAQNAINVMKWVNKLPNLNY